MKIELSELLTKISTLPWKYRTGVATSGVDTVMSNPRSGNDVDWVNQGDLSIEYATHAANTLPQLVEALKRVRSENHCTPDTDKMIDAALTTATQINQ